jgi:GNAT superfamily N-acetyltransferase
MLQQIKSGGNMKLEAVPATSEHIPELGRIGYEAFKDIAERHGFECDIPNPQFGQMMMGMLVSREDHWGATAMADGEIAGSNFLGMSDEVAGLGPITIDVPKQGRGIGRFLMTEALDHARENGVEMVRLLQDSFNMTSISLYGSLGFDTKVACAVMEPAPAERPDDTIRPLTPDDLPAVEDLSRSIYRVSRRNEVGGFIGSPFRPFVRERNGRVVGYYTLGLPGHGVAETIDDLIALIAETARQAPAEMRRCFCPLTEGDQYRKFLEAGFRMRKIMNLMAYGPYEAPSGPWAPSVGY